MDIGSILNQAGGASAIAQELGVDQSTVENGAGALFPHVANGIKNHGLPGDVAAPNSANMQDADPAQTAGKASGTGGLGGFLETMTGGAGGGGMLGSIIGGGVGNQILAHIFGSKDASRDVATQASQQSGVDTSILKKLLPIVAGAVAAHYMTNSGQGSTMTNGGGILGGLMGR